MLRKSDFTLAGEVDRLKNYEIKNLTEAIHLHCNGAIETGLRFGRYSHAFEGPKHEILGMERSLLFIGIHVLYQGEKLPMPFDLLADIIAEFEQKKKPITR
ncbi:hypothetical protein ACM26V_00230 [Salipaludibacillus sp. HK11]|uniref:hypothetical protein n=1 Tax=Salipaludibacillus sp. HK11 TaxID=3394320 RepID=UPI0039FC14F3